MDVPLRTLLISPRTAFESAEEPLSLAQVFAFVVVIGCVVLTTSLPLYANMADQLPSDVTTIEFVVGGQTGAIPLWFALGLIFAIGLNVLFWAVTAGVIHAVARIAGGEGSFRRLFVYVGWCHAPYLVLLPVMAVIALWVLLNTPEATLSGVLHGTSTFGGDSVATFNGEGLIDARSKFMWGVTLWIGYLWVGAVEVTYGLSRRRSIAVAGAVAALSLLLTLLPL